MMHSMPLPDSERQTVVSGMVSLATSLLASDDFMLLAGLIEGRHRPAVVEAVRRKVEAHRRSGRWDLVQKLADQVTQAGLPQDEFLGGWTLGDWRAEAGRRLAARASERADTQALRRAIRIIACVALVGLVVLCYCALAWLVMTIIGSLRS